MRRIAFVFTQPPHGSSAGREGLDAVLATSALTESIALFFLADGVFQLLPHQQPDKILARDYIATFGVLALYDINTCYVCQDSLAARGLIFKPSDFNVNVESLSAIEIRQKLKTYHAVLTF